MPQTVAWNGIAGGKSSAEGRYAFRVTASRRSGAAALGAGARARRGRQAVRLVHAAGAPLPDPRPARLRRPARRRSAAAAATRARTCSPRCGTPLVAARGGVVKFKQLPVARPATTSSSTATTTGTDYAYMHLREPALVEQGDRVYTGQLIGYVGDTGDADGCHLHFEEWTAPGLVQRRLAVDPLPLLRPGTRRRKTSPPVPHSRGVVTRTARASSSAGSTIAAVASNSGTGSMPILRATRRTSMT